LFIWGDRKLGAWVGGGTVVYKLMICPFTHNSHHIHYTSNPSALVSYHFLSKKIATHTRTHAHRHTHTHTVSLTYFFKINVMYAIFIS